MNKQEKLDLFSDLVSLCEEQGFSMSSNEFKQISAFALKDGPIVYGNGTKSLLDVDVEVLSDRELNIIIKRARTALKRILEMKKRYIAGPFPSNRHHRRMMGKQSIKSGRHRNRPMKASDIVKNNKESRSAAIPLYEN